MPDVTIKPRQPVPPLEVKLLDGGTWRLADAKPATFEMIVVYRGWHCPICRIYLSDLEAKLPEFAKRGVDVIAVSTDNRARATRAKSEWGLNNLLVGCELSIASAREWGLFISRAIREGERPEFSEPGLFLVKPDGTLFYAARSSAPWGRPPFDQMLRGIDLVKERKMPARGEA
jgi:peroxiredoxin